MDFTRSVKEDKIENNFRDNDMEEIHTKQLKFDDLMMHWHFNILSI
jgi:hypothetical protein